MIRKLPSLSLFGAIAAGLAWWCLAQVSWADRPGDSTANSPTTCAGVCSADADRRERLGPAHQVTTIRGQGGDPAALAPRGNHPLIRAARRRLAKAGSLSVGVRSRVAVFGTTLSGTGRYLQSTPASRRWALDLKLAVGGEVGSLKQVSDGTTVWTHAHVLDHTRLTRALLPEQQLLVATVPSQDESPETPQRPANWLAWGGLDRLLAQLDRCAEFAPGRAIGQGAAAGQQLEGTWHRAYLARLVPPMSDALAAGQPIDWSQVPLSVPERMELVLADSDGLPRRLRFSRHTPPRNASAEFGPAAVGWQVVIEWFDYSFNAPLDPALFEYQPGEQESLDETARYLDTWRELQAPATR